MAAAALKPTVDVTALMTEWKLHKDAEAAAVAARREIEDRITAALLDRISLGTNRFDLGNGHDLKITTSNKLKADFDSLERICNSRPDLHGICKMLVRFKPEIEKRAWDKLDDATRAVFSAAVTTEPARPTYGIEAQKEK